MVDCELQESDFGRLTLLKSIFIASALPIAPVPPKLSRIFRQLLQLEDIFFGQSRATLDVSDLWSPLLESLTVYDSAMTDSSDGDELEHLKHLHLHNPRMDAVMVDQFVHVFQNVRLFQVTSSFAEVDRGALVSVETVGISQGKTIKFEVTQNLLFFVCPVEHSCTKPACGLKWTPAQFVDGRKLEICVDCIYLCSKIDKTRYSATVGRLASEYEAPTWTTMRSLHSTRLNGFVYVLL
jgi:hypothetical protein